MSQAFNEIWHSWSVDNEYFPFTSKNKALHTVKNHSRHAKPVASPVFGGVSGVTPILSSPKPLVTFCCSKKSPFLSLPPFIQSHPPHLQSSCTKKFVSSRLDRCKWWVEDGLFAWACKEVFFFFFFLFFLTVVMVIVVVVIGFGVHD